MPALAEARQRLLGVTNNGGDPNEMTDAVESDAALAIAILRAANNGEGPAVAAAGVREAVDALTPTGVEAVVAGLETHDPFTAPATGTGAHERFRRHGVATRIAVERVAEAARLGQQDELSLAALLHDVGRLVLLELYGSNYEQRPRMPSPADQARWERTELGMDHALVGAVLVRRWGLGAGVATAIERHHAADAEGHAAAIQLADAIVHVAEGDSMPAETLTGPADRLGIQEGQVRKMLYEYPHAGSARRRETAPCPLSDRELDALRGLSEGKVYKQIAAELELSVSTIRTHLHNVYRKIGAVDRAQAVLIATEKGWV
jgi:putative nucleotidyltransferase with HDIG domain